MKAWQLAQLGAPEEVLELCEKKLPGPAQGEIALQVGAAAIGLPDVMMCRGNYEYSPELPFTPGQEVVGTVLATGEGVGSCEVGDRLMAITTFYNGHGGFAEQTMTVEGMAYPVPDAMPDVEAAAFGIPFHTAWAALVVRGCLQAGETLVVLGAAGGSGSAAVQLGRALGARVIAVAGGPDKLEQCLNYGAEEVIDHRSQDFVEVVNQLTSGRGADLVFDPVGGDMCKLAVDCLASEGRLLLIGFASGASGIPSAHRLLLRNCSVMGVFVGGYSPEQRLAMHTSLLELYTQGRIRPLVDRTIGFTQIPEALAAIEDRSVCGKIIASMA